MKHKNILALLLISFLVTGLRHELFGQFESEPHAILSARLRNGEESSLPDKCGLPAISAAMHDRALLTPLERSALERMLIRPSRQKFIDRGTFFRVHYDTTGANVPAMLNILGQRRPGTYDEFADSVASSARYSYNYIVDTLGYPPPPSDGGAGENNRYDIYITELGNTYGVTYPDNPAGVPGYRTSSFIEIDNDFVFVSPASNKGIPALRVTMAHEFFHAIQMGNYGFWTGDIYFYEVSSVWIEDVVYTDVNDYYQYLRSPNGHFMNPEIPFTTANGLIEYSRGIWGQFVEKRYGRDAMKRLWEAIRLAPPLLAINNALSAPPYSTNLRVAFSEWTLWNYFTGYRSDTSQYPQGRGFHYPEARNFPTIKQNAVGFTPPSRVIDGTTTPLNALGSRYYQIMVPVDTLIDTLTLILSNINLEASQGVSFPYRYLLNESRIDGSYNATGLGVFYKLDVSDLSNWWTWSVTQAGIGKPSIAEGVVFPNPFRPDRAGAVRISIRKQAPVPGTLRIFSSSMDLVYTMSGVATRFIPDVWTFEWNGKTDKNTPAGSGVYFYILELLDGGTIKGKFALIRK